MTQEQQDIIERLYKENHITFNEALILSGVQVMPTYPVISPYPIPIPYPEYPQYPNPPFYYRTTRIGDTIH